jgi:hypothetical protein
VGLYQRQDNILLCIHETFKREGSLKYLLFFLSFVRVKGWASLQDSDENKSCKNKIRRRLIQEEGGNSRGNLSLSLSLSLFLKAPQEK